MRATEQTRPPIRLASRCATKPNKGSTPRSASASVAGRHKTCGCVIARIASRFWVRRRKRKAGFKRLAANVAPRLELTWRYKTQGFLSKARGETTHALKQAKRAHRDSYVMIVDRYSKDKRYAERMDLNGVGTEAIGSRLSWTDQATPPTSA